MFRKIMKQRKRQLLTLEIDIFVKPTSNIESKMNAKLVLLLVTYNRMQLTLNDRF